MTNLVNSGKKRSIVILSALFCMVLISVILFLTEHSAFTPTDTINQKCKDSPFEVAEEIASVTESQNENVTIHFYYNTAGSIACGVLRKQPFEYDILCLSGCLVPGSALSDPNKNRIASAIDRGKGGMLYWGILDDRFISGVKVASHDAQIISAKDLKLWYYIGDNQTGLHDVTFSSDKTGNVNKK